jgi:hypothetical protein
MRVTGAALTVVVRRQEIHDNADSGERQKTLKLRVLQADHGRPRE